MRFVAVILLLGMLGALPGGYLYIYRIQKECVRQEVKAMIESGIQEEDLTLFIFPEDPEEQAEMGIRWIKEDEFLLNGVMYDVVSLEKSGGMAHYYCYQDNKETRLRQTAEEIADMQSGKERKDKERNHKLMRIIPQLFGPVEPVCIEHTESCAQLESHYMFRLKTWIRQPSPPPPESEV